jgi:hypothetical protein
VAYINGVFYASVGGDIDAKAFPVASERGTNAISFLAHVENV